MLKKKIIDLIIIISLIGIFVLLLKDALTKTSPQEKKVTVKPTIAPNDDFKNIDLRNLFGQNEITDFTSCQNDFFPFDKGTKWQYQIIFESTDTNQKKTQKRLLTNTLIEISTSSAKIESEIEGKKIIHTLFCRQKGIYGFPFPLSNLDEIKQLFSFFQIIPDLGNLDIFDFKGEKNVLLIPNKKILEQKEWNFFESSFFNLPVYILIIEKKPVLSLGWLDSFTTAASSSGEIMSLFTNVKEPIINYQAAKGVGITEFNLNLPTKEINISVKIKLIGFWKNQVNQ